MGQRLFCTWTHRTDLPPSLKSQFADLDHLLSEIIVRARQRLLVVAPYLSVPGVTRLKGPFAAAAANGAWIRLVTSGLKDGRCCNAKALNFLVDDGGDGEIVRKRLRVLCPKDTTEFFIHAKLVVADGAIGYLGSANLSDGGLEKNFEVGVALSSDQATTFERLIDHFEASGLVADVTRDVLQL
jgi:phosphatidylserine/phosphatidylglycerophosphate/cardiolipin synthase-like enzyme